VVTAVAAAARAVGCAVHAGSVIERDSVGHLWNTSVLLDATGAVTATYRKMHRFGFGEGEPLLLEAGPDLVTADVPTSARPGGQPPDLLRVGLATCYDLRFPEMFRALLDAGSSAFVVPAAWPAARVEHWTLLGRARAVENQCVVIAANTAGTHARHTMGGRSQVIGPMGEVLGEAGDEEEILVVDVDPAGIAAARVAFPVLADRRLRPTLQG
jgi:predicted amidohydrolase